MFERLATGWRLAKQSIEVLKLDKELLVFPLLSGISCILVLASFLVPLFVSGFMDNFEQRMEDPTEQALMLAGTFAFYFANYFVITFFNSALVGAAVIRLKGGDPTVSDGMHAAFSRLPQIAAWALVAATVGMILKMIESRSERVGQIVAALLGTAWSITTFFVVPVIVIEGAGPIDALKRSVSVMKKAWGESLAANYGIGFIIFLVSLLGIGPIVAGGAMLGTGAAAVGGVLIALGVIILLIVSLVSSALNSIILAALYVYAAEDRVPDGFDPGLVNGAFARAA